ncbi:MAG: hypothetical protein ABI367_02265 [Mucilaginibacter sp.]
MKSIFSNVYTKVLIYSLAFTLIVFLIPWNKIFRSDEKIKIVYVTAPKPKITAKIDTPKTKQKIDKTHSTHLKVAVLQTPQTKTGTKVDTPKKEPIQQPQFNLQGANVSQSALGINPVVNNYNAESIVQPTSDLINKIKGELPDKNAPIDIEYEGTQKIKNRLFAVELMATLKNIGYINTTVKDNINYLGGIEKRVTIHHSGNGLWIFVDVY